jgi:RND family efflux transporter MFP subunit
MVVVGGGCAREASEDEAPASPAVTMRAEDIVMLEMQVLRTGPALSGDLVAERSAAIRAELGGSIVRVEVEAGQRVAAGEVLAAIDETGVADQLRSARSALTSAENAAQVARRELDRARRLVEAGALSERDLELAERGQLSADAQLEGARAGLAAAQNQWQKTQLRAPFAGIVSERMVNLGDVVQPGTEAFTVVDPSSMRLEASVPVSALTALRPGSSVDFEVTGYEGQPFTGRVLRVNPSVDPGTRQVRITVAIPNRGNSLVAGLFARGRVAAEERTALAVPLAAVDLRGPTPTVRRIRGGQVEAVAIQLGLRDEVLELVEVTSGVAAGDTLIRAGATGVAPGTAVVVRKE